MTRFLKLQIEMFFFVNVKLCAVCIKNIILEVQHLMTVPGIRFENHGFHSSAVMRGVSAPQSMNAPNRYSG